VAERSVTPRGFVIYDQFTDTHGNEVRVQQSSGASEDCVWIFCAPDLAPHLTTEMAIRVRDALDAFVTEHAGAASA
jgi:hypothetical protein